MSTVQPFPLGPSYGAELLATFVSVALWGTTCMQTLLYFVNYQNDSRYLKLLVIWLWIVDTVHQVLIVQGVYTSLITDFCDYGRARSVVPEFLWQVFLTSLVAIPSQFFFTYRLWMFTGKKWMYFIFLAPATAYELVGGLVFIAIGTITPTAAALVSFTPASIFTSIQGIAAVVDIGNAAGLVYLLWKCRENALPKSRNILHNLVILTINTGIWTALFAIFTLITIVVYKDNLIYAALYFPLCPLYCNTVLANLNARTLIASRSEEDDTFHLGPVFMQPSTIVTGAAHPGTTTDMTGPTLTASHESTSKEVRHEHDESQSSIKCRCSQDATRDRKTDRLA
ncbi:hypothetical protein BJ138DRAFT_1147992 [Hygrophoropsis aurantiaca]|uniref:Uncharacterized protein n=2 Tax=Hygrophoropsis aurantiaca TaxID=72124 RepID=A0ACB7ZYI1_9AGAM|nr:hypothetical protein BJ138DRAFT_1164169 [Hygrophoropsis aurantiaca]KAH7912651.1 hypothetical protein BJ138DRAFT_1147992 [Hygrophoropsis aurantiaca]